MLSVRDIERSEHSQNGEDGILAYLARGLVDNRRLFVEIGTSGGRQCNTTALARAGWSGHAVEARGYRVKKYLTTAEEFGFRDRVEVHCMTVTPANVPDLAARVPADPDVFSLDIDGADWHVAAALLANGFRPKIAVVEYNAAFGRQPLTVPLEAPPAPYELRHCYFGCSIEAWKRLWEPFGYRFVTVESSGINAFFVRIGAVADAWLARVAWLAASDCRRFALLYGSAKHRFKRIAGLPLCEVPVVC